jgi:uncharacterized protein (DUF1330 family)
MQHSKENHRSRASSVIAYDNKEKAQAVFTSPAYKQAGKISDKYAKLQVFVIEGVGQ